MENYGKWNQLNKEIVEKIREVLYSPLIAHDE